MIKQNPKYKIALVGDSLAGGGAERVHALLSVFFCDNGIDVHNCIFVNKVGYKYAGTVLNLGEIAPKSISVLRKARRFAAFRKFIRGNDFDAVIDFRMRSNGFTELIFSKVVYPIGTIYTIHSGILDFYFPRPAFMSRLIYKNHKLIAVSKAIRDQVLSRNLAEKVDCIYNPTDFGNAYVEETVLDFGNKYILAVGRMNDEVKQFDKLIISYSQSNLPQQNIKLLILGDGKNKQAYIDLSQNLGLAGHVVFKDYVQNPFPYYKNALFSVLSSRNEGFPNVIIEALAAGTPVVAFDCFSGPGEIITDEYNGLLVADQNFDKLTEAMARMAGDIDLYSLCKANARQSVKQFSIQNIGEQWLEYLKIT